MSLKKMIKNSKKMAEFIKDGKTDKKTIQEVKRDLDKIKEFAEIIKEGNTDEEFKKQYEQFKHITIQNTLRLLSKQDIAFIESKLLDEIK